MLFGYIRSPVMTTIPDLPIPAGAVAGDGYDTGGCDHPDDFHHTLTWARHDAAGVCVAVTGQQYLDGRIDRYVALPRRPIFCQRGVFGSRDSVRSAAGRVGSHCIHEVRSDAGRWCRSILFVILGAANTCDECRPRWGGH
jgi:hypothetical protein